MYTHKRTWQVQFMSIYMNMHVIFNITNGVYTSKYGRIGKHLHVDVDLWQYELITPCPTSTPFGRI